MAVVRASLLLATLAMLAGCRRDKLEYHRVEFPGFSLEVPARLEYTKAPAVEYRAGVATSETALRHVLVNWQPGEIAAPEELPATIRAFTAVMPGAATLKTEPARSIQIGGHDATQLDARVQGMRMSLTSIACGKRVVTIVIGTRDDDGMREKIPQSIDCHPIAAQEALLDTTAVPFGTDDPALLAGWYRVTADGGPFVISNGELVLIGKQIAEVGPTGPEVLDKLLPIIFAGAGTTWTTDRIETRRLDGGERVFHRGRISEGSNSTPSVVTLWSCGENAGSVLAVVQQQRSDDLAPAIDLLAKLRCAKPGDPPLPLAPAPADAAPGDPDDSDGPDE